MKKYTEALFITLITLSSVPVCAMEDDETTPFLRKETVHYSVAPKKSYFSTPISKDYPATNSIAPQFGFTDEKTLNFFHAIEDNQNISPYLKDEKIVSNWRILAVGKNIAEKTSNEKQRAEIARILKTRYKLE